MQQGDVHIPNSLWHIGMSMLSVPILVLTCMHKQEYVFYLPVQILTTS